MARMKVKPLERKVAERRHSEQDVVRGLDILARGHPLKMKNGFWYLCGGQIPDGLALVLRNRAGLRDRGDGNYLPVGAPP